MTRVLRHTVAAIAMLAACCSSPAPSADRSLPPTASADQRLQVRDATPDANPPLAGSPGRVIAPPATDAERIASALSAAPMAVANDATIMTWDMRGLRVGTNGWTCIPDGPSPRVDPICLDGSGAEWIMALMHGMEPATTRMGIGYMLMGGWNARSRSPLDATFAEDRAWVDTGPHVMIVNIGDHFEDAPTTASDPTKPYILWAGTPYAHLVIPLK